jgi:hypothetical protein
MEIVALAEGTSIFPVGCVLKDGQNISLVPGGAGAKRNNRLDVQNLGLIL